MRAHTCRHFHTQADMCTQVQARITHGRKDTETTPESQVLVGPDWVVGARVTGQVAGTRAADPAGLKASLTQSGPVCPHHPTLGPGPSLRTCHIPTLRQHHQGNSAGDEALRPERLRKFLRSHSWREARPSLTQKGLARREGRHQGGSMGPRVHTGKMGSRRDPPPQLPCSFPLYFRSLFQGGGTV